MNILEKMRANMATLNSRDLIAEIYAQFGGAKGFAKELKLVYSSDETSGATKARLLDIIMSGVMSLKDDSVGNMSDEDIRAELKAIYSDPSVKSLLTDDET